MLIMIMIITKEAPDPAVLLKDVELPARGAAQGVTLCHGWMLAEPELPQHECFGTSASTSGVRGGAQGKDHTSY